MDAARRAYGQKHNCVPRAPRSTFHLTRHKVGRGTSIFHTLCIFQVPRATILLRRHREYTEAQPESEYDERRDGEERHS
jgi:hypothetical protein